MIHLTEPINKNEFDCFTLNGRVDSLNEELLSLNTSGTFVSIFVVLALTEILEKFKEQLTALKN